MSLSPSLVIILIKLGDSANALGGVSNCRLHIIFCPLLLMVRPTPTQTCGRIICMGIGTYYIRRIRCILVVCSSNKKPHLYQLA